MSNLIIYVIFNVGFENYLLINNISNLKILLNSYE
jgi:hypothetical protein